MASVWTLGTVLNVEVPGTIKVVVNGELPKLVSPKDIILHLIGKLSAQGANFKVIEFHGDTIKKMSTSGRLTLCNMSVEAGATSGIVPPDEETVRYLREEAGVKDNLAMIVPDADAIYEQVIEIDASKLVPQIAFPHTVDNVKSVDKAAGIKVNQIVIGSCTNGRIDDIEIAASILKGRKVAQDTRMLIFPASWKIYKEAMSKGYLLDLINAGATIMNPGCGCCLGVHQGALGDKEVSLSTTNRNFKGRQGNPNSDVYLCSPAVAAASAITGVITDPRKGVN
jgi:3-isopropylmalate/(R)-2-methylmalate dehydratase large subunit